MSATTPAKVVEGHVQIEITVTLEDGTTETKVQAFRLDEDSDGTESRGFHFKEETDGAFRKSTPTGRVDFDLTLTNVLPAEVKQSAVV